MVHIASVSEHDIKDRADEFQQSTMDLLTETVHTWTGSLTKNPTQEDLGTLHTAWADQVPKLLPMIQDAFVEAANAQRVRQRNALISILSKRGPIVGSAVPEGYGRSNVDPIKLGLVSLTAAVDTQPFEIPAVENPEIEKYLVSAKNKLVGLGDDVWDTVRETLIAGNYQGLGVRDLREAINDMAWIETPRAGVIARTEINRAANAGTITQMRQIDAPTMTKTWLAVGDGRTRMEHAEADGQTVGLNDTFDVGGEALDAPGDGSAENCVNCRCTLGYDIPDDDLVEATQPCDGEQMTLFDPGEGDDSSVYSCQDLPLQDENIVSLADQEKFTEWFSRTQKDLLDDYGYLDTGKIKADISQQIAAQMQRQGFTRKEIIDTLDDVAVDHYYEANNWWRFIDDARYEIVPQSSGRGWTARYNDLFMDKSQVLKGADIDRALATELADKSIAQWAATSSDSDAVSLAIQQAAKAEFGLASEVRWIENPNYGDSAAKARELYSKHERMFRSFVRAEYENTQRQLAAQGIDYVEVYRGMSFDYPVPEWVSKAQRGDFIEGLIQQPASSYAFRRETASGFGNFIIRSRVPRRSIMSTARTGCGCYSENEIVVLGNPGRAEVVANTYYRTSY